MKGRDHGMENMSLVMQVGWVDNIDSLVVKFSLRLCG